MRDIIVPIAGAVTAALAIAVLLVLPGAAGAETKLVELRVEGDGETLDEGTWYATHGQRVKRGKRPSCKPAKGKDRYVGATALTALAGAQDSNAGLQPLRTRQTDFGPQVCQIGEYRSFGTYPDPNAGFFYYVNYAPGFSSPDVAEVANGDSVLWHYVEFPADPPQPGDPVVNTGCALQLHDVPAHDADGEFTVEVTAHGFGCAATDSGVEVVGAGMQTSAGGGFYDVRVDPGTTELYAERDPDVRSNRYEVCVGEASECPAAHGRHVVGSNRGDRLPGTQGDDRISARRGKDRVVIKHGGRDAVNCGGGRDVVIKRSGDGPDEIADNCERVVRR